MFVILLLIVAFYCIYKGDPRSVPRVEISIEKFDTETTYRISGFYNQCFVYESPMKFETFKLYVSKKKWRYIPITKPIKIVRYTWILGLIRNDDVNNKIYDTTMDNETPLSYVHYIKEGFYYEEKLGRYIKYIVYDTENSFLYYYVGEGWTQNDINPYWSEEYDNHLIIHHIK